MLSVGGGLRRRPVMQPLPVAVGLHKKITVKYIDRLACADFVFVDAQGEMRSSLRVFRTALKVR